MCNIIINTFYISDKILSNNYVYDIIGKLQLTTSRCGWRVAQWLATCAR